MNVMGGKPEDYLYRYETTTYGMGVDEYDNPYPGYRLELALKKFRILKRTPKGAWIERYPFLGMEKKFVLLTARKKFACETIEEALESFIARKKRQIQIVEAQLEKAKRSLRMGEMERSGKKYSGVYLSDETTNTSDTKIWKYR